LLVYLGRREEKNTATKKKTNIHSVLSAVRIIPSTVLYLGYNGDPKEQNPCP
jgi:hypothetical protein